MTPDRPVALVVGAASRDVAADDQRGWRLGGAVTYVSLALARLGVGVRALVGVDREARDAAELTLLAEAGAIVTLAELDAGPVFENVETPAGRRQLCLSASDPLALTMLPRAWTSGFDALVLAPIAGEIDESWARLAGDGASALAPGPRPALAVGWQGLLRHIRPGHAVEQRAPEPSALLRGAALVVASRDDFGPGTSVDDLLGLLGPSATLVLTAADAGGEVVTRGPVAHDGAATREHYPAIPSDRIVDPTGAGDVFLAAMLAARLIPTLVPAPGDATRFAAAAASLSIEWRGSAGVPGLTAIRERMTRAPSLASRRPSDVSSLPRGRPSQA